MPALKASRAHSLSVPAVPSACRPLRALPEWAWRSVGSRCTVHTPWVCIVDTQQFFVVFRGFAAVFRGFSMLLFFFDFLLFSAVFYCFVIVLADFKVFLSFLQFCTIFRSSFRDVSSGFRVTVGTMPNEAVYKHLQSRLQRGQPYCA